MKKLILLCLLMALGNLNAQKNGHYSFKGEATEDGDLTVSTIDLYVNDSKTVIVTVEKGVTEEKVIIDRVNKKVLEIFNDLFEESVEDQKYYAMTIYDETGILESSVISDALVSLMDMPDLNEQMTLLDQKRVISGLNCQKFTISNEAEIGISGWIALGVHVKLDDQLAYIDTENGMIVEFEMVSGEDKLKQTLVSYDSAFPVNDPIFSMEIPAGYSDFDEYLDEYSDEEEVEEEE